MSDLLERQLYTVGEAARLLMLPSSTLRRWLEGFTMLGRSYDPVIRPAPTGSDIVTWAEFVEAGFLREYRAKRVSLQYLRPVIDEMRKQFKVPYPLAHFKPLVDTSSRQLVLGIQQAAHLEDELALLVRLPSGQLQWAAAVQAFIDKVEFDAEGVAERMHPLSDTFGVELHFVDERLDRSRPLQLATRQAHQQCQLVFKVSGLLDSED